MAHQRLDTDQEVEVEVENEEEVLKKIAPNMY